MLYPEKLENQSVLKTNFHIFHISENMCAVQRLCQQSSSVLHSEVWLLLLPEWWAVIITFPRSLLMFFLQGIMLADKQRKRKRQNDERNVLIRLFILQDVEAEYSLMCLSPVTKTHVAVRTDKSNRTESLAQ